MRFITYVCVFLDCSNSDSEKLKAKQYKQKTSPKSYKTEINYRANPMLA